MRKWIAGCVVATVLALPSGCASVRGRMTRALPDSQGYDDGTDSSDPWIAEGASEGRVEFSKEKEADPFGIKPLFMSQKARDIEKNLGIE